MSHDKWHKRYVNLAEYIAQWSKDPSTKTGSVIVRPDNTIASVGYNGFPRGIEDKADLLYNREGLPASPFRTDDWPLFDPNADVVTVNKPAKAEDGSTTEIDWERPHMTQ